VGVRVALADDEPLLRAGLKVLLEADARLDVVADVGDGAQLLDAVERHHPDVVLIDVQMPVLDGLGALRKLAELPDPPVAAVLTTFDLDDYVAEALDLGAQGFLLKDAEPEALAKAVVDLAAGGAVLDPRITARLLPRMQLASGRLREAQLLDGLSGRERQVLDLVACGQSNASIAADLGLTEATVKSYVSALLTKLGVANRVQAALFVQRIRGGMP
jgi:DNA-binding NarL/FixJ family response regulator